MLLTLFCAFGTPQLFGEEPVVEAEESQTEVQTETLEAAESVELEAAEEVPSETEIDPNRYRRSSLCMLLMKDDDMPNKEVILSSFLGTPIPHKYNDHNVAVRIFKPSEMNLCKADYEDFRARLSEWDAEDEDEIADENGKKKKKKKRGGGGFGRFLKSAASVAVAVVSDKETTAMFDDTPREYYEVSAYKYLNENNIPKEMFDMWFLNDEGNHCMDRVIERGMYDADLFDVQEAASSHRGLVGLGDAGNEMVGNSFVVVSRYRYLSKDELLEEISATAGAVGSLFGDLGASVAGVSSMAVGASLGAGYYVRITSFLYQLAWDDDIANQLFDMWDDMEQYHSSDMFGMKYIGHESAFANVKAGIFTNKEEDELIQIATINATDAVLAKLEKKYDVFKTKTPILTTEPLTAAIGLKEGLEPGDKYEVLEARLNGEGVTEYKRVGVVTVSKDQIWDNRYMAAEELEAAGKSQEFTATRFDGERNKYYPGMLLRQLK